VGIKLVVLSVENYLSLEKKKMKNNKMTKGQVWSLILGFVIVSIVGVLIFVAIQETTKKGNELINTVGDVIIEDVKLRYK